MRRKRIVNKGKDKRVFTRTADRTKYRNIATRPMRGGIRL